MEKIWGFHDLKPGQGCNFSKLFYPEDFDADMQNGLRGWDIFWGEGGWGETIEWVGKWFMEGGRKEKGGGGKEEGGEEKESNLNRWLSSEF